LSHQFRSTSYAESCLSSQGSTSTQNDNDVSSQNLDEVGSPASQEMQLADNDIALMDALESPGFVGAIQEYLRGNMEQDSPGGSWNSQGSISPPQYSLPIREQPVTMNNIEQDEGWLLVNAGQL